MEHQDRLLSKIAHEVEDVRREGMAVVNLVSNAGNRVVSGEDPGERWKRMVKELEVQEQKRRMLLMVRTAVGKGVSCLAKICI